MASGRAVRFDAKTVPSISMHDNGAAQFLEQDARLDGLHRRRGGAVYIRQARGVQATGVPQRAT